MDSLMEKAIFAFDAEQPIIISKIDATNVYDMTSMHILRAWSLHFGARARHGVLPRPHYPLVMHKPTQGRAGSGWKIYPVCAHADGFHKMCGNRFVNSGAAHLRTEGEGLQCGRPCFHHSGCGNSLTSWFWNSGHQTA